MLPRSERLTKNHFKHLKPKVVFRGVILDIAVVKKEESRFACVITKKRVKRAVDRNKIKRKIYSILREIKPKVLCYVVIYPKQIATTSPYLNIKQEIQEGFDTLQ